MSKVRNSQPKKSSGAYERVVGNKEMADIFTKVHSTAISNGSELERIIIKMSNTIKDLDAFIESCDNGLVEDGAYLCTKKAVKASGYKLDDCEPDFLVFSIIGKRKECNVIELKDGDDFDKKKSLAEKDALDKFVKHIAQDIQFKTKSYICSFNQSDEKAIVIGFKKVFSTEEVMTGRRLCEILKIDYDAIVNMRKNDIEDNFNYVLEKMFEIKEVRDYFTKHISEKTENG